MTPREYIRSYNIAEQWLSTYRMSNNPRHLETARICFVIADELYGKSVDENRDDDQAVMQRIRLERRKRVIESFAALGVASCIVDGRNIAAAPMEEPRNPNQ